MEKNRYVVCSLMKNLSVLLYNEISKFDTKMACVKPITKIFKLTKVTWILKKGLV